MVTQVVAPESTRERFLAAGMRLFAAKGYQSTSIADLLQEVDAHSGSFYHFFPTQLQLWMPDRIVGT
jgi:AcrR family transcriptional regulator